MKTIFRIALAAAVVATMAGCKVFRTLTDSRLKTAQGAPYELIVVCPQQEWTGEVGDTLRAIFTAPIPYLNQTEPLFDVLRVTERGFTGMVADHRNILKVLKDPTLTESSVAVQYNVTSDPQIVMTLMGPNDKSITAFLSANRGNIVLALENAERDRAIKYAEKFNEKGIHDAILKNFGVEMNVPKGYALAANEPDFLWARYEYPTASQGFFIYSYPYEGKESLSPVGRFIHDHLRRLRARFPHVPHGGAPLVRDARLLGRARRFHGRPVRKLHDRRHGDQPRLHARLLHLLAQKPQTQLHARRGAPALPGKIPRRGSPAGRAAAIEPARQRHAPKKKPACNKY